MWNCPLRMKGKDFPRQTKNEGSSFPLDLPYNKCKEFFKLKWKDAKQQHKSIWKYKSEC